MYAPYSESIPFLTIAKFYRLPYWIVLCTSDWLLAGEPKDHAYPGGAWWKPARTELFARADGHKVICDILAVHRRLAP
jgi:hypothetical protein